MRNLCRALVLSLLPCSLLAQANAVIRPKVVVVAYFEVGEDSGDKPGELQLWVERDHLDRVIVVPGMTHVVHANAAGTEIAVTIGPSDIKPAINLMALGADPRLDLRESHWLLQGHRWHLAVRWHHRLGGVDRLRHQRNDGQAD